MHIDLGTTAFWDRIKKDPARLASEVCSVDVINLDETLQHHAALRAWVNAAYETARIGEERIKWEETKARAIALLAAKAEPDPDTGKPKTVAVLNAEVDLTQEVQTIVDQLLNQQEMRGTLRAMTNALEDRKDTLIQIAAKQRKELGDYN